MTPMDPSASFMVPCFFTVSEMQVVLGKARASGKSLGLVPTMGALHDGHLSLVSEARANNDVVVVSVFVNPTQFGPTEDLARYPRDLEKDRELAQAAGADLIFCPSEEEMYLKNHCTWVEVEGLTEGLCGASRPGHFRGVCTVVNKLFNICRPDRAYFGQKDAQQLAVIRRMVRDLNMGIEIVACPIVRELDGLAMSSRNVYLSSEERAEAPLLYSALRRAKALADAGERDAASLQSAIRGVLAHARLATVEYVAVVDAEDLSPVTRISGNCLIALAVRFGGTRLIDNIVLQG